MNYASYSGKFFELEETYANYQKFLKGAGTVDAVLCGFCPAVAHLCRTYVTLREGDFDDFCADALIKVLQVLTDVKTRGQTEFLPNSKEFRNFFFTCTRNSFSDTIRKLGYQKYTPIGDLTPFVCRKVSPRFLTDYNMFQGTIEANLLSFVLSHDRYGTDPCAVEFVVQSFLKQEDASVEVLHRLFRVVNPYFVKVYLLLLVRIYMVQVKEEYDSDEISYYVDERLEAPGEE